MRNNSVTKRRRKIRTGRIKTHQPQMLLFFTPLIAAMAGNVGVRLFLMIRGWGNTARLTQLNQLVKY